jgi:hypothetical protein
MTETTILLAASLAVIALMAILIYVASRNRASTIENIAEIRRGLDLLLGSNRNIEATLKRHGHVLFDAHKKIHEAVTKGLEKPAR